MREKNRRETLIAMTQTEIMLVLVMVMLVLLSFKQGQLSKTERVLQEREQALALAIQTTTATDASGMLLAEQLDLEVQLNEKLVELTLEMQAAGHVSAAAGVVERQLVVASIAKATALLREQQRQAEELREALSTAIAQAQGNEIDSTKRAEELLQELTVLRHESKLLRSELAARVLGGDGTSDLVGFIPCWRGAKSYYFTFDLTYRKADDKYHISLHEHASTSGPQELRTHVVAMPALHQLPTGWVSLAELAAAAQRVQEQQQLRYAGSDCKLATTLNKDADGDVVGKITDLGWYPVYR